MRASRRSKWRRPASQGLGVGLGALALAASLTLADAEPTGGPSPAERGGESLVLSPEPPLSFGDRSGESPWLAAFNAARASQGPALEMGWLAEPKFDLASASAAASQETSPQGNPPIVYDPTAGAPLSPIQSALRGAMERLVARADRPNPLGAGDWRAARAAIAGFYASRFYAPVWVDADGMTEAGRAALSQLERAGDDGLDLSAFALPRALKPALDPDVLAEAETIIASAVVAYAEQAMGSRAPPRRVSPLVFLTPSIADPGAALAETAAAVDPAERLADFNPPQKGYRELRDELKRLEAPESAEGRGRVLAANLDPGPLLDLQTWSARRPVKRAVGARVHTASASTSDALAFGSLARRRAAILANMEMWRWEPRDMGERRVEVNVADFSVAALEGERILFQARAIVGKPQTPTLLFSSIMRYVEINPSWLVPESIIRKELLPKLDYLSRHGYEVKTVAGRLTVRQLPGEDNALGRIAFMFPNDHAIYLHDTPTRELFDEEKRALSHGCVRVEDPLSLAEFVLGGEAGGWTADRIEAAIGGRERTVFLPRPLPIHIEYFTDFVDEFGELRERPDIYGLTRKVEGILGRASQD